MPNQRVIKALQALYRLFSTPDTWGQRAYYGTSVDPVTYRILGEGVHPSKATCFCLVGALMYKVDDAFKDTSDALQAQLPRDEDGFTPPIEFWNDRPERTQNDILVLIQRALDAETAKA